MTTANLVDVATYYAALPQQKAALQYLQSQIPDAILQHFTELWRSAPSQLVTLDNLMAITSSAPKQRLEPFVTPLNAAFLKFSVNTPLRVCHFLAQVLHESGEFLYQEETASGAEYEGREDLGNTQPGDGENFKGRGLIQVTGRDNYAQLSHDLGVDYLNHPEQLAQLPDCIWSAFWYWNYRGLSVLADKDDFDAITYRVNGGYNGYDQRKNYLMRAKNVLMGA